MGKSALRRNKASATRRRACTDKRSFPSLQAAQAVADALVRAEPWRHPRIAYECQYSGGTPHWHIGRPFNIPRKRRR
ncbi:hypothetical protein [Streptomyces sp. RKAG337]|uniref:hypothetical protein n=1 Tax=Streptomyces sp. RKAG337 TaxID=2893404 RepID=UPI0020342365|nr:hypothetical protein [Streptomyces sp. RKAG337]MCM2430934.1 hypothetical protein [Streptomyces sp. RKAG337]